MTVGHKRDVSLSGLMIVSSRSLQLNKRPQNKQETVLDFHRSESAHGSKRLVKQAGHARSFLQDKSKRNICLHSNLTENNS